MIKELISYYEKFLKTEREPRIIELLDYFWRSYEYDSNEDYIWDRTADFVDDVFARFKELFMNEKTYLINVEQKAGWALPNDDHLKQDRYREKAYCKDGELTEKIAKFHFNVLCQHIEEDDLNIDDY